MYLFYSNCNLRKFFGSLRNHDNDAELRFCSATFLLRYVLCEVEQKMSVSMDLLIKSRLPVDYYYSFLAMQLFKNLSNDDNNNEKIVRLMNKNSNK